MGLKIFPTLRTPVVQSLDATMSCVCDATQAVPALTYPHLESHQAWDRVLEQGLQAYVGMSPYSFGLLGEGLKHHPMVAGVALRSMQLHQRLSRQRPVFSIARGCRVQRKCIEPSVARQATR